LRGSRWAHEVSGEDPDAWDAVLADVDDTLRRSLAMLGEIAQREGVDLETPIPEEPRSLYAERLRRAGVDYSLAFAKLFALACAEGDETALEASSAAIRVGPKIARLSGMLPTDGTARFESLAAGDAHANLMLVEELDRRCVGALPRLFAPDPDIVGDALMAAGRLFALLAPLQRQIPRSARRALSRLVAAGCAPSPFQVSNVIPIGALTGRARSR
jgi:hypothetical protein